MIQINYGEINGPIPQALNALAQQPLAPKTAWHIMKLNRKVKKEVENARELHAKLIKQYVKLDAEGNPAPKLNPETGKVQAHWEFTSPESEESYQKGLQEFFAITADIDLDLLKLEQLEVPGVRLSAEDLEILAPFFHHGDLKQVAPTQPPVQ